MGRLSDIQIRQFVKAGKPIAGKADGDGLTFTLSAAGTASWVLRYRFGGRQKELTIGNYPDLSLAEARKLAAIKRVEVGQGTDVAAQKRVEKIGRTLANSFREMAEDYMVKAAPALSDRYRLEIRRYLDKDILPRIGGIPARDVTPGEIVTLIERIGERSKTTAKAAFTMLAGIFDHGIAKHIVTANPCSMLKSSAILGKDDDTRSRVSLSDQELPAFLAALPGLGKQNELALKIILATAVRKGELSSAKWSDVDMDAGVWRIPAEHQKGKRKKKESGSDFVIPLPHLVVEWFRELQSLAFGSPMVLPARHRTGAVTVNHSTFNRALSKLPANLPRLTPHDLRSTARSHLAALGVDVIVAERCLNHSLGGLLAIYDQHDYLEERRRALSLWAGKLEAAMKGEGWNVVPIKGKTAA